MYDNFYAKYPSNMFAVVDLSEYSEDNPRFTLRYNYTTNYGIFTYNQSDPSELEYTKIPYQKEYIFFLNGISSLEEAIYRTIYNKKSSTKMNNPLIKVYNNILKYLYININSILVDLDFQKKKMLLMFSNIFNQCIIILMFL